MLYWLPEGLTTLRCFTTCLMTTTTPAKPRRRRAKRAVRQPATVSMNQQTPLKVEVPTTTTRPSLPEPYVQSHLSDVQLISRDALWNDLQNRMKINNREVGYAMAELKVAASWTNEQIKKLIKRIESVELK